MLAPEHLDHLVVVLVRARNPNNIGAVARAMHDLGFRHLRIVNEYPVPFATARSAVDASSIMQTAVEYATLTEAVADCRLVVGTTAVGARDLQHPLYELPQASPLIRAEMGCAEGRVALLFGSEKTGLSNDELSYCHWLMTIPMHRPEGTRHLSMNLGQAAAVCLFDIVRSEVAAEGVPQPATSGELERLTELLTQVLEQTGYTRRHPANCDPAQIRRLVRRMALDTTDAPIWMGILRQVIWRLRHEDKNLEAVFKTEQE